MAYALQSMLKIRGLREEHAQAELVQAKAVQAQAERELRKRTDARIEYEAGKEERRDKVYAAVIGRTVKMDDLDRARSAVTRIDEEGILLAEAERKARAEAERKAKADAERKAKEAERRAHKAEIKKLETDAYTATKEGKDFPDDPNWSLEQKCVVRNAKKKAKDEIAAAKKAEREAKAAAKAKAASARMDLFGFNV